MNKPSGLKMSDVGKNVTDRIGTTQNQAKEKQLTTNAMINPMLKFINTCMSILRIYSTMDSSLLMDLIPMNLRSK